MAARCERGVKREALKVKRGEEGLSRLSGLFGLSGRDRETSGKGGMGDWSISFISSI